jgi:hypothetical protein
MCVREREGGGWREEKRGFIPIAAKRKVRFAANSKVP